MRPSRLRRTLAAAAITTMVALSPAVASAAEAPVRPRVERACLRIPNLQLRTERLHRRLLADEHTTGSLAWLQVQIDRAEAAGRTQLVTVLENRLAVRTQTVEVLERRTTDLDRLSAWCREHRAP